MCIGMLMANRELYVLLLRLISSFRIETDEDVDLDPITGVENPASTVSLPKLFKVHFVPRDLGALREALSKGD